MTTPRIMAMLHRKKQNEERTMNDQPDQQAAPSAETTSAVEWLKHRTDDDGKVWIGFARELAERCDLAEDNARQSREEIEALKADVAAITENHGEWMRRAMAFQDQLAAAQADAGRLREACQRVLDWYDRDGSVGMASSCFEDMRDTLDALKEGQP